MWIDGWFDLGIYHENHGEMWGYSMEITEKWWMNFMNDEFGDCTIYNIGDNQIKIERSRKGKDVHLGIYRGRNQRHYRFTRCASSLSAQSTHISCKSNQTTYGDGRIYLWDHRNGINIHFGDVEVTSTRISHVSPIPKSKVAIYDMG